MNVPVHARSESDLDAAIYKIMRGSVPGLTIFVVTRDGVQWAKGFGVADIEANTSASADTVYMWFSLTKLVTATCILQLVEDGRLRLDDPALSHCGSIRVLRPTAWMEKITIRHLLSHSSGIGNPIPIRWVHQRDTPPPSPSAFLQRQLKRNAKLHTPPGETAKYSNLNYLVLGEIIASIAKQPYQEYVRERVLSPLGMSRTDFLVTEAMRGLRATPYQKRWSFMTPIFRLALPRWVFGNASDGFVSLNPFYVDGPAYGGLIGSAKDAAVFLRAHLRGGEVAGNRILTPESVALMQQITARGKTLDVALGWYRRTTQQHAWSLEHLGGGAGYFNVMRIYPDSGVGVLLMGNATTYDYAAIIDTVARYFFPEVAELEQHP